MLTAAWLRAGSGERRILKGGFRNPRDLRLALTWFRALSPFETQLFESHEPAIDLVYALNVLIQSVLVGIFVERGFEVAALEVVDDDVELIHFGVHETQVTDQPDLINSQKTFLDGVLRCLRSHSATPNQRLYGKGKLMR